MLGLAISLAGTAEDGYLTAIAVSMWPLQVGTVDRVHCPVRSCCLVSRFLIILWLFWFSHSYSPSLLRTGQRGPNPLHTDMFRHLQI